jgi:hypothetical protein
MTHCLENKKIMAVEMASDKKAMRFMIDGGGAIGATAIIARADGDCRSSSWIEHVEMPAGGLPAMVLKVENIDLPGSSDDDENFDCLQVYGLKIITNRGDMIIDFRNASNGYYGGSLSWPDDSFYGGVWEQNVSSEDWQPITL